MIIEHTQVSNLITQVLSVIHIALQTCCNVLYMHWLKTLRLHACFLLYFILPKDWSNESKLAGGSDMQ